jgi:hypothetical protein
MERVAVPVGRAAAVLSGGPGAAVILKQVENAASSGGGAGAAPASGASSARGYSSFKSFKRAKGPAGPGKEWHHIVEQTDGNVGRFGPKSIHNTKNIVALDKELHSKISALYSSKRFDITSTMKTVREWMSTQSFEAQRDFGLRAIENVRRGNW